MEEQVGAGGGGIKEDDPTSLSSSERWLSTLLLQLPKTGLGGRALEKQTAPPREK